MDIQLEKLNLIKLVENTNDIKIVKGVLKILEESVKIKSIK